MNSRERVFASLSFQQPDRVPVDFWGSEGFFRLLKEQRELDRDSFLDRYDIDLRYIDGPRYIGPPITTGDGITCDLWGVPRRQMTIPTRFGIETYAEVVTHPLAHAESPADIEAYPHWPSADWFDYSSIRAQCAAIHDSQRVVVFMGDRLNRVAQLKPAMYLRGIEQVFVDMVCAPEILTQIIAHIRAFYEEYLQRILQAADGLIDIVLTGDDFGSQNAPLVSPALWKRFFGDGFCKYLEIIHRYGARSMHHTCGRATTLVPDMVERGLHVLQSLQPEAMSEDFANLKRWYYGRLAFHGGISVQRTLPHRNPQDVGQEVRERITTLGQGGGYILCTAHNVQTDCPLENVHAMLTAAHDFGRY